MKADAKVLLFFEMTKFFWIKSINLQIKSKICHLYIAKQMILRILSHENCFTFRIEMLFIGLVDVRFQRPHYPTEPSKLT